MSNYRLMATASFGLEAIVAQELKELGFTDLHIENGKVLFNGDERDIVRCNLHLRCADRVFIVMNQFSALDFEELYQGALSVEWEKFVPENGKMHITGKSVKSKLFSVSDCQSIVKKAVVRAMQRKYPESWFSEDGPVFKIEVALLKDVATLSIDTSGDGLHKRGYRTGRGEAPLRENLAAALVKLSRWNPSRILVDPFCGSGTIPVEAAMAAANIPSGLKRKFAAENWFWIPSKIWKDERQQAEDSIREIAPVIFAFDNDKRVFNHARENAENAGVLDYITFQKKPISEFSSSKKYGCVITNPPYGERLGDKKEAEELYTQMGKVFSELDTWSFFVLTSHEQFEKLFGRKSDKNRKLYNGKIKTRFYQYYGALPPRNKD